MSAAKKKKEQRLASQRQIKKTPTTTTPHCCVPLCKDSSENNPQISYHRFPANAEMKSKWLRGILRKDFVPSAGSRVCSRHFLPDDFMTSAGPRLLNKGAVPRLFEWNDYTISTAAQDGEAGESLLLEDHTYCMSPVVAYELWNTHEVLKKRVKELREQLEALQLQQRWGLHRLVGSDDDIRFYLRFASYDHFKRFWRWLEPTAQGKMVWFNGGSRETDSNLAPVDELVLFLMYLSAGLEPFHLAHSFMISDSAVERIIATWTHFLYSLLGSLPVWLPPEEVKGQLPPEFSSYPDTQVVLHCVEIRCERPPSTYPPSGFMIYSPFQYDQSFRALIGIAPHGAVTYVSRLYGSWCSDRDVFKRSGIADYLSEDAAVMFSEGFYLVDGLCPGKVHRPVMPDISEQMTEEELEPAREMGRLRYHIDRSKYRVLENRLLEGIIPLTMSKRIDQLFAIACLLVNFQHGPLTKTWNTSDFD